ncbi:MAG: serine hydrolase [Hyphomicrobiales bacterium]|nr:serine hydrolase [Hyphomicrobiales bacterium]
MAPADDRRSHSVSPFASGALKTPHGASLSLERAAGKSGRDPFPSFQFVARRLALGRTRARFSNEVFVNNRLKAILCAALAVSLGAGAARANPAIVIDAASGDTLYQQDATRVWFPASLSKLMTVFVALKAVKEGRITLDTPMRVSAKAAKQKPSKMGFRPGTLVTLDNALKMLMVKSANDLAVVVAEGVSGSVDAFAGEMNAAAESLGMRDSHFVNPNGLPDPRQVSSARDMAILGRALYTYFPEQSGLFNIGAMQLGDRVIPTHNGMLGRYPGADGMKTGYTCAAGFNIVASATRNGRRLIVAVLGSDSAKDRTAQAASLLDNVFAGRTLSSGAAAALPSTGGQAPDMRQEMCSHRTKAQQAVAENEDFAQPIQSAYTPEGQSIYGSPTAVMRPTGAQIAALPRPSFEPIPVYIGAAPGWTGRIAGPVSDGPTKAARAKPERKVVAATPAKARPTHAAKNKPVKTQAARTPAKAQPKAKPAKTAGRVAAKPRAASAE